MPEPVGSNYFPVETALRIEKSVERGSKALDPVFEGRGSEFNNCFFLSYLHCYVMSQTAPDTLYVVGGTTGNCHFCWSKQLYVSNLL